MIALVSSRFPSFYSATISLQKGDESALLGARRRICTPAARLSFSRLLAVLGIDRLTTTADNRHRIAVDSLDIELGNRTVHLARGGGAELGDGGATPQKSERKTSEYGDSTKPDWTILERIRSLH